MTSEALAQVTTEVLGWLGCVLLIVSILQRRILALRVLSLISSLILMGYNLIHGVWPMVAMNAAIVVINAVYLARANRRGVPRNGLPFQRAGTRWGASRSASSRTKR